MRRAEPAERVSVVRVIARMNVGGPAFHAMHLSEGLVGYPTLLVTGEVADGEADMSGEAVARGVSLLKMPELGRRLRPWQDLVALVKLIALLRRVRPEVVHTHTAKAGTLGRLAALVAGVPVRVHTFHGHIFDGYFSPWVTRVFLWIERLLARFTTCVVAISESQANELSERYRVCSRDRLRVVPLGLELERFSQSAASGARFRVDAGAEDRPLVTTVGRLVPIKNHRLLVDVAKLLVERGVQCRFAIVGGGSEEPELRRQVRESGLEGVVRFMGWRSDLEEVYAGSDVVALTSNNEGTPVCLIEALSAGRAVVATDVGGVRDVLEGGKCGLIVSKGDVIAMADAIQRLLGDSELRAELGRRGADSALARFGVDRLLGDIGCLYDDLLERQPVAAPGSIPQLA